MRGLVWKAAALGAAVVGLGACSSLNPFDGGTPTVVDAAACVDQRFDIYFDEGRASLSREARALVQATAERLKPCDIDHVQVLGLTSATGGARTNLSLSEQRALAVVDELRKAGWPTPVFEVLAAGESGAIVEPGIADPLRRRVEVAVTVKLAT